MLSSQPQLASPEDIQRGWAQAGVRPIWEIEQAHRPDGSADAPGFWPWRTMAPLVERAVEVASPSVAERRALGLIDPTGRPGDYHTIANLNAALQVLLPGEAARPHRHSMDALRFVLEGAGAVTRVDGKLAPMAYGDLVITPGWCWHEHWNEGNERLVWLDVLNVHLHVNMGTMSFEPGPPHDVPQHLADAAFATANVVPDVASSSTSPVFRYPFAGAKQALEATPIAADGTRRVRYVNPLTGGPVMPLLDCYLIRVDPGAKVRPFLTNAHAICAVVEGRGTTTAGDAKIAWERRDVFTLPARAAVTHSADEPSYIFVCSDREILRRLNLLIEKFGDD